MFVVLMISMVEVLLVSYVHKYPNIEESKLLDTYLDENDVCMNIHV